MKNLKTYEKLLEDIAIVSINSIENNTNTRFRQKQNIIDHLVDDLRESLDLKDFKQEIELKLFKYIKKTDYEKYTDYETEI